MYLLLGRLRFSSRLEPEERKMEVLLTSDSLFLAAFLACSLDQSIDLLECSFLEETPNLRLYLLYSLCA